LRRSTTPPANIAFAVTAGGRNYTLIFDTEDLSWSLSLVETVPFEEVPPSSDR